MGIFSSLPGQNKRLAVVALVAGILLCSVGAAIYWYKNQAGDVAAGCHLQRGACISAIPDGGTVRLKISPRPIAFHSPLEIDVSIDGIVVEGVEVDFAGLTEPTSFNRVPLRADGASGRFVGEVILPLCMPAKNDWQATVLLDSKGQRLSVPFIFNTDPTTTPASPIRKELSERPGSGNFILGTADGAITLERIRAGKVVMVIFSQIDAPVACAFPLQTATKALALLEPEERKRVQGLLISLNPGEDTPQKLKEYLAASHPGFIGATGADADLIGAARLFGVGFTRHAGPDGHPVIHHSAMIHLVAPDGRLAGRFASSDPKVLAAELRKLLAAGAAATGKP